jgi:hypothetical protein
MTVAQEYTLDVMRLRRDFPILNRTVNEPGPVPAMPKRGLAARLGPESPPGAGQWRQLKLSTFCHLS